MPVDRLPLPPLGVPVIAVLRADLASRYPPVIDTLVDEGITGIELTLSTRGTLDVLPQLAARYAGHAAIGVGTVTRAEEAEVAAAHAAFIVTPIHAPAVLAVALTRHVPIISGGLTPTELHAAWSAGAAAVKVFPADVVGRSYIKSLQGPFPGIRVVPSGGVGIEDAAEWLQAGAVAVSLGGALIGDALRGGALDALRVHARRLLANLAIVR
ncbi:MAG TPA: bifunctional 4-hydroxy-2-oxoglutarate aldolase/2-dehydro-3-deoxy-phosphogluconate aldolase [Rhodanobacteraceae bacterium]|nr:bifunctional 4-hydroxy-2-oxoglutarate aldolase/2-dehydro-3-deoxy-phosphogluconate aldolase [Rhodanobacteraceae bacterium]